MVCVEELWQLAQAYDPSSGEEFLANIRIKLMAAVQGYAMRNLKGFSEISATHYYQLRKAAFLYKENRGRISYVEIIALICQTLNITEKTAQHLLQEMDALDHFQWYTNIGSEEDEDEMDAPVGNDILGHCCAPQPEQKIIREEYIRALAEAFEELTEKEQDVIGMHLGFCHNCFRIVDVKTYDEIADVYQFGTEAGVRRFYQRSLDKLRLRLAQKGFLHGSVKAGQE
jgi:DNA-directed RNA polymerase specialized sigma subunit